MAYPRQENRLAFDAMIDGNDGVTCSSISGRRSVIKFVDVQVKGGFPKDLVKFVINKKLYRTELKDIKTIEQYKSRNTTKEILNFIWHKQIKIQTYNNGGFVVIMDWIMAKYHEHKVWWDCTWLFIVAQYILLALIPLVCFIEIAQTEPSRLKNVFVRLFILFSVIYCCFIGVSIWFLDY
eukprot:UN28468